MRICAFLYKYTTCTHNNIDDWEDSNSPVSSEICISSKCSNQRCDIACSRPVGEIFWSSCAVLIKVILEIQQQISAHPIVCQSLTTFISWKLLQVSLFYLEQIMCSKSVEIIPRIYGQAFHVPVVFLFAGLPL